ncbi:hypothetical protein [Acrocarpospora catenulata]|uniref:hypothetical protein n=1 Tax=Acrocarpospora catenulata TaxID=2836182 RepID=UPI001BDB07E6|nr:hypothetical protein [Acrocarpospora catenulata]
MASHLVATARALEQDEPERAYEHAKVARRFAARIGVVREAAGIAAYRAGQYAEALGDLRAARRMTGSDEYLPIMADSERGLGRPERALDLVKSKEAERLDRAGRIELAIVESGARRDLGQHDAAVITLQRIPELRDPQPKPWSARLAFAYADALSDAGHEAAATDWFGRAMAFDEDGQTDAAERYAELTGALIEDIEEDEDEEFDSPDLDDLLASKKPDEPSELTALGDDDDEDDDGDEDDGDEDDEEDDDDDEDDEDLTASSKPDATDESPTSAGTTPASEHPESAESSDLEGSDEPPAETDTKPEAETNTKPEKSSDSVEKTSDSSTTLGPAFIEPDFGDAPTDTSKGGRGEAS